LNPFDFFISVSQIISKGDYIRDVTEDVKRRSKEIMVIGDETNDLLNSTKYLNQLSDIYVREAADNYEVRNTFLGLGYLDCKFILFLIKISHLQDLASLRKTLQITRKSVEKKRNTMDQMSQEYKETYVIPAQEHADYLMNISKKFTK
jgi:cob(I)alamin adenosyltransferase